MVQKSLAGRRYALALLETVVASKKFSLDEALGQLGLFNDAFLASFELRNALLNPAFTRAERDAVLEKMIEHLKLDVIMARFVKVLAQNRRIGEITDITETFRVLADERRGRVRAVVHSAAQLSAEAQERLRRALERTTGKSIDLELHVDPTLIGGVRARVGSIVFDGTIRTELDRLRAQLAQGE